MSFIIDQQKKKKQSYTETHSLTISRDYRRVHRGVMGFNLPK